LTKSRKFVNLRIWCQCFETQNYCIVKTLSLHLLRFLHCTPVTDREMDKQHLVPICKVAVSNDWLTLTSWSGWVSVTNQPYEVTQKSVIGYMAPILFPITDYATVQECLTTSIEACSKLQQKYALITMDLAAAKIALDIKWSEPETFCDVIINPGAFHVMCSYLGALGKMMSGSGFEDVVIEANFCVSGSITHVMSRKHYNRSMRVHQIVVDAVEWLLAVPTFLHPNVHLT